MNLSRPRSPHPGSPLNPHEALRSAYASHDHDSLPVCAHIFFFRCKLPTWRSLGLISDFLYKITPSLVGLLIRYDGRLIIPWVVGPLGNPRARPQFPRLFALVSLLRKMKPAVATWCLQKEVYTLLLPLIQPSRTPPKAPKRDGFWMGPLFPPFRALPFPPTHPLEIGL